MAKPQIIQDTRTIAYANAGTGNLIVGYQPFWIFGLILELEVPITRASGTSYQDPLWRLIQNMTVMGKGRPYLAFNGPDLRALYWHTRARFRGRFKAPDTQAASVTYRHQLPILFTPHPLKANGDVNWEDTSVGIEPSSDLNINLTWAANTAYGATSTVGAGTVLRVSYIGSVLADSEKPKYYPHWFGSSFQPTQVLPALGTLYPLTPGSIYRRTCVVQVQGASPSDNRTDDVGATTAASEIGLVTADGRKPINLKTHDASQMAGGYGVADDNAGVLGVTFAAGVSSTAVDYNPGVYLFDYGALADVSDSKFATKQWGVDLTTGKQTNVLSIGFSTNATSNVNELLMHEAVLPY